MPGVNIDSILLPYFETKKEAIKSRVSGLLTKRTTRKVAKAAFDFQLENKRSFDFQKYYCKRSRIAMPFVQL